MLIDLGVASEQIRIRLWNKSINPSLKIITTRNGSYKVEIHSWTRKQFGNDIVSGRKCN